MTAAGQPPKMQVSDNFVTRTELLETGAVRAAKTVIEILENRRHGYFKKVSITKNAEHDCSAQAQKQQPG